MNITKAAALFLVGASLSLGACSTAPDAKDQSRVVYNADVALDYFTSEFPGLRSQLDRSAAYVIYPDVAQWGIVFSGGRYGRGVVARPDETQVGWGALNTASFGLQAGIQGFRMLIIFEDEATFRDYQDGNLNGNASAVAVAGSEGGSTTAPFIDGVAVYQGANSGLLAGVNFGLDIMRYEALGSR
ncbi:MAG: hypothetical protein AAGB34_03570 [Planctomycetota bacterium]